MANLEKNVAEGPPADGVAQGRGREFFRTVWKRISKRESVAWLVFGVIAAATRFWNLGARVMSHDESLHVYYSWSLAHGSGYAHNPMMHGPLLFEITGLMDKIFGNSDFTARIPPALIGLGIVLVIPLLLRTWLGRWGVWAAGMGLLVSPYVLTYSRYNRHDIEVIAWVLLAVTAILSYIQERTWRDRHLADARLPEEAEANLAAAYDARGDRWLVVLAVAEALMFATMEISFIYLAIFASYLVLRLLLRSGWHWQIIRRAPEFDLLVVLASLGAFFSAPIMLLALNPLWVRLTGLPFVDLKVFSTYGIEWSTGTQGLRIWGLLAVFALASVGVGVWWNARKWLNLAGVFIIITVALFTTFFSNWSGVGTGFVGSLGYWLSQQSVSRGGQPWYYYFIVFPLYEYLPLLGALIASVFAIWRWRSLSTAVRLFVPLLAWWGAWIFIGLTAAGEKMPWLSTHITVPLILLTAWWVGRLLSRYVGPAPTVGTGLRWQTAAVMLPVVVLWVLTARTAFLVNYVNYDYTTEFIDYAHGGPGVKWLMADLPKIANLLGQADPIPVAYDSANSWPLAWYLRDNPGFYGDQPNRAGLQNAPVVIAGPNNWSKVDTYLGANYHRYEVIRIWWPMEDYKNLTWARIRGAITDPAMRAAVWDILWARDYRAYAALTHQDSLNPPQKWPLEDRMRIYIRKDLADKIPDLALQRAKIDDLPPQTDAYADKRIVRSADQVIQSPDWTGPRNLAFAPDGSLYILSAKNARVVHIDTTGKVLNSWGSLTPENQTPPAPNTFNDPWGIAVDGQGNVYVADTWNHRVQKFDGQGNFLLQWGVAGLIEEGPEHFWGPRGIASAPDGNLYVTDTGNRRVAVFDPQGTFLFDFGKAGADPLNEPVGIAIDGQGRVFVADTWNNRVAIFDSKGVLETSWPVQAWSSGSLNDKPFLALGPAQQVYLSDPEANRVLIFSDKGVAQAVFGDFGDQTNAFNLPTGLAIDPTGKLWVADTGNNRLDVFAADPMP